MCEEEVDALLPISFESGMSAVQDSSTLKRKDAATRFLQVGQKTTLGMFPRADCGRT